MQTGGRASPALTRCRRGDAGDEGGSAGGFSAFGSHPEIAFGKSPWQSPWIAAPERTAGGEPALTCPLRRPAALGTARRQSRRGGARRLGPAREGSCQAIKPRPGRTAFTHKRTPRAIADRRSLRFPQRHGRLDAARLTSATLGTRRPKRCSRCSVFLLLLLH